MFSKIFNLVSKILLGGSAFLLTACYAPILPDYPAMYAPPPASKINRSISGIITYAIDKSPASDAFVKASYIYTDSQTPFYYAKTDNEGFYYIELEDLPVDEMLTKDYEVDLYISNTKCPDQSVKTKFTQENQEEHIDLNIELAENTEPDNNNDESN